MMFYCWLAFVILITSTMAENLKFFQTYDTTKTICTITNITELNPQNELNFHQETEGSVLKVVIQFSVSDRLPYNLVSHFPNATSIDASNNLLKKIHSASFFQNNNSKLTDIDLSNNKFNYVIPSGFVTAPTLKHLNLSHNQINDTRIFGLKSLMTLDLSNNKIKKFDMTGIEESVTNLNNISLQNNQISKVKFVGNKILKYLDLSCNNILNWPEVTLLESLLVLNFSYNSDLTLPSEMVDWPEKLTHLSLSNIQILNHTSFFKSLDVLTQLTDLELNDNQIKQISGFPMMNSLERLSLDGNELRELNINVTTQLPQLNSLKINKNNWDCSYLKLLLHILDNKIDKPGVDNEDSSSVNGIICKNSDKDQVSDDCDNVLSIWACIVMGLTILYGIAVTILLFYHPWKTNSYEHSSTDSVCYSRRYSTMPSGDVFNLKNMITPVKIVDDNDNYSKVIDALESPVKEDINSLKSSRSVEPSMPNYGRSTSKDSNNLNTKMINAVEPFYDHVPNSIPIDVEAVHSSWFKTPKDEKPYSEMK